MSDDTRQAASAMQEVRDRCRRIELRLTRYMEAQGFDTQVKRAAWKDDGTIVIPSPAVTFKEMMAVVPSTWSPETGIRVEHKKELLAWVFVP